MKTFVKVQDYRPLAMNDGQVNSLVGNYTSALKDKIVMTTVASDTVDNIGILESSPVDPVASVEDLTPAPSAPPMPSVTGEMTIEQSIEPSIAPVIDSSPVIDLVPPPPPALEPQIMSAPITTPDNIPVDLVPSAPVMPSDEMNISLCYIVKPGETLQGICEKLRVDSGSLLSASNLTLNSPIVPGLPLIIPDTNHMNNAELAKLEQLTSKAIRAVGVTTNSIQSSQGLGGLNDVGELNTNKPFTIQ